ncbi:hypothetical protein THTE_3728 [Thermogutta terrifontis]|uniref:Uncharacterized protein n=1 Tax=Thermogutta terrifontis TaxID=1331910 RepID=A0A286RK40_9BACT|nr:hypothetical protein THTE_3728 [Thermogutta terrifontis]
MKRIEARAICKVLRKWAWNSHRVLTLEQQNSGCNGLLGQQLGVIPE